MISSPTGLVGGLIGNATIQKNGLLSSEKFTELKQYCSDKTYMVADISSMPSTWRMLNLEVIVSSTDINKYIHVLILYVSKGSSLAARAIKLSGNDTTRLTIRIVDNKLYIIPKTGDNMYVINANTLQITSDISGGQIIDIE